MSTPSNSTIASSTPSSSAAVTPTTSSSTLEPTTSSQPSSSSTSSTPSSTSQSSSSSRSSSSSSVALQTSTTSTTIPPSTHDSTSSGSVTVVTATSTHLITDGSTSSPTTAAAAATSSVGANLANPSNQGSSSSTPPSTIAVATVVPIVAVVLLVLAGIWFWRKRKDRKNGEEMRRKEMEEYGFNPNNDPTLPVSSVNGDEPSTARETDAGYRGWGATSTMRKASTTMSSSQPGMARSDSGGRGGHGGHPSPPIGMAQSDGHSDDPLVRRGDDVTALGAAPTASSNRPAGVNRGPSNASSAYSGANYSDVSAEGPLPHGSPQDYGALAHPEDGGAHNPYGDGSWNHQPVIRDVSARRNTRIESPGVVHQQGNSGISQNF